MDTYIFYGITVVLLIISFVKDRNKTFKALKKAWKAFENILPQFLGVIMLVGVLMAVLNTDVISKLLGQQSGFIGILLASVIGSVTLIPGFVAFPTASILLENGAGYMQIAAFISTLMMVGIITLPIEIKYFGKRIAFMRNGLAFLFSILVALIIGEVMLLL